MGPPASPPPTGVSKKTFTILYRAHFAYVRERARRAGVVSADQEDVIQAVFVALSIAIGRGLDLSSPLHGWLRATTYRTARDQRELAHRKHEQLTSEGEIVAADRRPSPEAQMEAIDARRLVHQLLDQLSPELREVLVMSDLEEMPMREIAEVLEIPEGTGYTRLRAARAAFEAAWRRRRAAAPQAALAGIAPFVLFDAHALLNVDRSIPDPPPGLEDRVLRSLVETLGPGLGWTAGAAGAAATAATAATNAGAVALTAKQIAIGLVLSALAGAGVHAALRAALSDPAKDVAIAREVDGATSGAPRPSDEIPAATATATAASASADVDAGVPVVDQEASERNVLKRARAAIGRAERARDDTEREREIAAALAALEEHRQRFKRPRLADEREALRRQALAQRQRTQGGTQP